MRKLQVQLGLVTAIAILALPSAAQAQRVVPPGNSAVNQYTETFPTARGPAATKKQGKQRDRSPAEALGARKVRRLESEGPQGRELAAIVAATAPTVPKSADGPRNAGSGSISGGESLGEGSSSFGHVIAQATGSDSGMGIALPLLILAAFVGFAVYLWRRRRLAA
jgi:hypothetical protein